VKKAGGAAGVQLLRRRELFPDPLIDGRDVHEHSLGRFKRRVDSLLVSRAEREEFELERRLRAHLDLSRPNLIAAVSPKGGVGKTTTAFLAGNLLASHLKLRVIAVDVSPSFGTLGRLPGDRVRSAGSVLELLRDADRVATAADLRRYVSRLPSGLHVLAAQPDATRKRSLGAGDYGELVALLSCFYEAVVLDLAPGVSGTLPRFALDRADQALLVTTPDEMAARLAVAALRRLDRARTTVVVNRANRRLDPELRAIEEYLQQRGLDRSVELPDDRRLALMLDTGTYTLEALDRLTRVGVKRLGLAVAERLV
jgi:MinD-like ATPase involved in chromosome partitioning or flagellar assembly